MSPAKTALLSICLPLGSLAACAGASHARGPSSAIETPMDTHSFARPREVRVEHVSLDLALDFEERLAVGKVELELERLDPEAPLRLDTSALAIESVRGSDGKDRPFELTPLEGGLGEGLTIRLEPRDRSVTIAYRTTPAGDAMQWLDPEQTASRTHPFVFTQGQAILTRSWIPLQDSPGVRVTYEAVVHAPEGLTAVMSAEQQGERDGWWRFRMQQPIPPYLIALACGKLEFRELSKRCGVYAEPALAAAAAEELADTEVMLRAAEELFGPYRWGRYDMIVLPPAFPFGGMENPRLTFLTPTMLAGDKSLVALIAHEMAHSWSGNLVTNATWRDFWLNEGTTVYCEGRIMEAVYGKARVDMETVLGVQELEREMATLEPRDQILHVDLEGRHPDDGFSDVPYEKGAWFLRRLEQLFGRAAFDAFLREYFDAHAFQSITTPQFAEYLKQNLLLSNTKKGARARVQQWLYEPGIPHDAPRPASKDLERLERALLEFGIAKGAAELDTVGWEPHHWLYFLENLPATISAKQLADLDREFSFTDTANNEILAVWLRLAIRTRYEPAQARLEQFLMEVGRRKFLEPLYKELAKTPEGLERAREIYARARPRYHAVSRGTLDKVLGWGAQE
jgi:aminopeptidase N